MLQNNRRFPADWPPNCPPEDAVDTNIKVFGCSKEFPPGKNDFKTAYEKNYKPEADPCLRRGLSVSLTCDDAEKKPEVMLYLHLEPFCNVRACLKNNPVGMTCL